MLQLPMSDSNFQADPDHLKYKKLTRNASNKQQFKTLLDPEVLSDMLPVLRANDIE